VGKYWKKLGLGLALFWCLESPRVAALLKHGDVDEGTRGCGELSLKNVIFPLALILNIATIGGGRAEGAHQQIVVNDNPEFYGGLGLCLFLLACNYVRLVIFVRGFRAFLLG